MAREGVGLAREWPGKERDWQGNGTGKSVEWAVNVMRLVGDCRGTVVATVTPWHALSQGKYPDSQNGDGQGNSVTR